jgi:hypothetical protein
MSNLMHSLGCSNTFFPFCCTHQFFSTWRCPPSLTLLFSCPWSYWKNISVLVSGKRRIQAKLKKKVIKITITLIRKRIQYNRITAEKMKRKGETFPALHTGNGSRDSKWCPSSLKLILSESWRNTCGQRWWIWVAEMAAKTGRCHPGLIESQGHRYASELPFARPDILRPSMVPKSLLTPQRQKPMQLVLFL